MGNNNRNLAQNLEIIMESNVFHIRYKEDPK